jgi:hypothetical protein
MLKYDQIQVAVTVTMTIIRHYMRSGQVTLWIHLVHYVPAKNLKYKLRLLIIIEADWILYYLIFT